MPVTEHRRLGLRGRAAGEEEHGHRLGIDEGVLSASFGFATEHRVGESVDRDDASGVDARCTQPLDLSSVSDDRARRHPRQDRRQLLVRRSIVQGRKRRPRQRRPEQRDRQHVGVQPEVADGLRAVLLEQHRRVASGRQQRRRGEAPRRRPDADPVGVALRHHLQQHGDVHGNDSSPGIRLCALCVRNEGAGAQSDAGNGFAPLTSRTVSPTEIEPSPAFVHRISSPSASSA